MQLACRRPTRHPTLHAVLLVISRTLRWSGLTVKTSIVGAFRQIAFQADLGVAPGQVAPAAARRLAGCADTGKVAERRRHRLAHILGIDSQELKSLRQQFGRPIRVATKPTQFLAAHADIGGDAPELARRTSCQLIDGAPATQARRQLWRSRSSKSETCSSFMVALPRALLPSRLGSHSNASDRTFPPWAGLGSSRAL